MRFSYTLLFSYFHLHCCWALWTTSVLFLLDPAEKLLAIHNWLIYCWLYHW
jgi:hypothetical protein